MPNYAIITIMTLYKKDKQMDNAKQILNKQTRLVESHNIINALHRVYNT